MSDNNEQKRNEAKGRIFNFFKNKEIKQGIALFHKVFNEKEPPEVEFLKRVYTELNRLENTELGFRLIEEVSPWFPLDGDMKELRATSRKIFFDYLLAKGNQSLNKREEKAVKFEESLKRTDSLARDRVKSENEKILTNLGKNALAVFQQAYELNPDSIGALTGLLRCYRILNDVAKIEEISKILEDKSPFLKKGASHFIEEVASLQIAEQREFDIEEFNILEVQKLYESKHYSDVIKRVDELHLSHKVSVPLLILKADSLVELRRFNESDLVVKEADRENSHLKEVNELKMQIREVKFRLLSKAGKVYLTKGLELGKSLGKRHFKKARKCVRRALDLFPENIDLLDQLYTIYIYLDEDEEAFRIKAQIYKQNPRFIPTFDKEGESSFCFFATYLYFETPSDLEIFRWFRREILLPWEFGKLLNRLYVKISPNIVNLFKRAKVPKALLRFAFCPVKTGIGIIKLFLDKVHINETE